MTENNIPAAPAGLLKAARIISGVFSPLMIPTYAYAMALWITPLSQASERLRFISSFIVFLISAAIPMFVILFLMRAGIVSDTSISNRKQRPIPYAVTFLCYLGAAWYVAELNAPQWLWMFFVAAAAVVVAQTLINYVWKISAHMASMGGLVAFVFYLYFHGLAIVDMLPWICMSIILAGAVGTSRLLLNRHTPAQVFAGFFLALALVLLII